MEDKSPLRPECSRACNKVRTATSSAVRTRSTVGRTWERAPASATHKKSDEAQTCGMVAGKKRGRREAKVDSMEPKNDSITEPMQGEAVARQEWRTSFFKQASTITLTGGRRFEAETHLPGSSVMASLGRIRQAALDRKRPKYTRAGMGGRRGAYGRVA